MIDYQFNTADLFFALPELFMVAASLVVASRTLSFELLATRRVGLVVASRIGRTSIQGG